MLMTDLRRIVDDIRSILYSDVDPDPNNLETLVNAYVESCEEVNRQLRACDDLLHRGLRDEAIQKADAQDLLDQVTLLDFPEREQWADYVSTCGLPLPPAIEIDRAADLNEAYDARQPLEPLMRLHRLHALAKSPLPTRIAIMRRIAQQDGNNPIWTASIKEFERERQRQLTDDVKAAIKQKSIKSLASLEQELRSPNWTTKPPKSLIKRAMEGHTKLRQDRARMELDRLQHELNDAYADFDSERARRARARWNALSAIVDFDASDSQLLDLVGPAFQWLSELDSSEAAQQEYEENLAKLRTALDDWIHHRSDFEYLKSLEEALTRSEAGIPEVDRTRLEERYRHFHQVEAGRRRWKVAGAVSAVVLLAGLTGLIVVMILHGNERDRIVAALETLIAEENLDGAQQFVTKLESEDPGAFNDSRIQKLRSDLDGAVEGEQARQQTFREVLDQARSVGLTSPSWESFDTVNELLKRASDLAKLDSEILAFNKLGREIQDAEREMRKDEENKFLEGAEELQKRYEAAAEDNLQELQQLASAYDRLLNREHVPAEIKRTPREIQERIQGQISGLQRLTRQEMLYERITNAVGRRQAFQEQLAQAQSDSAFSQNRQSQEFDSVLRTDPRIWAGIEAWNDFISDFEKINLSTITPEPAAKLISRSSKLIADHPGFPGEPHVKQLIAMLEPVTKRATESGQRTDAGLSEALTNETIARVYYLKTKRGENDETVEWFYSDEKPSLHTNGAYYRIQYFKNLNLDQAGTLRRVSEIANSRAGTTFDWLSPQSRFSETALRQHRTLSFKNWDVVYLEMLSRLLNDEEMDPVFKYQLLQAIIPSALQGSWPLQQGFQKHKDLLLAGRVNTQNNYFDPGSEESRTVRESARDVLKEMPDTTAAIDAVNTALQQMRDFSIGPRHEWLGWLHLDRSSNWVCDVPRRKKPKENVSGELYVISAPSTSAAPQFRLAGRLIDGQIQLEDSEHGMFVAGRPVFLRASSAQ